MYIHAIIIRQEREPKFEKDHRGALGVLTGKEKVLQLPKIGKKNRQKWTSFFYALTVASLTICVSVTFALL